VRLAHGTALLRRGYSFTDGLDARLGQLDAGLFFLAYMNDPAAFVPLQTRLGAHDALNEYIKHVGSGVWAGLPRVRRQADLAARHGLLAAHGRERLGGRGPEHGPRRL
jgi:deferrochelatase/peroxidase EfeB